MCARFPACGDPRGIFGRMANAAELEHRLVATPEVVAQPFAPLPPPVFHPAPTADGKTTPCCDGAPLDGDGSPRRRLLLVHDHDHMGLEGVQDTAARLMEESSKAQANGEAYANFAAQRRSRRRTPPASSRSCLV